MRTKARKPLHHPRSPQKRFRDRENICAKRYRSLGPFQDTVLARAWNSNTLADQEIPGLDAMQTTNGRIFVSNKPNEDYEQDQQVSLHTRPMSR
ncbi:hypothetical protein D6C77_06762 [Aureobasidium pullulans]|uniref:Uncharacterized protein n=1 Tax=Aureobasidium pullulans TaxID=5580 RepID=A0AB74J5E6_AURPU|nr:hypothetical protein D6D21_02424 [Aureobasidium pullulans]TIA56671.1 hypothetical protein D6C77_06762 [Aureobasidium pullulans]